MKANPLSELHNNWSLAIGSAIIGFGDIEWVTHEFLTRFSSDDIGNFTSKLLFSNRVNLIKEIMLCKQGVDDLVGELIKKLDKALELSDIRNVIVHNPLQVSIYADEEGNVDLRDELISYRRRDKVYTLNDIIEYSEETWSLARELRSLYSRLDSILFP